MICNKCNNQVAEGMKFCTNCGNQLVSLQTSDDVVINNPINSQNSNPQDIETIDTVPESNNNIATENINDNIYTQPLPSSSQPPVENINQISNTDQNQHIINSNVPTNNIQQPQNYSNNNQTSQNSENDKIFKILSYLGILFLIGLFAGKDKKDVRFHVGQGMILFIVEVVLNIVVMLINGYIIGNIFVSEVKILGYGTGTYAINWFGILIQNIISFGMWGCFIFLMVIGIINVNKNLNKELPIIGKFAFYK